MIDLVGLADRVKIARMNLQVAFGRAVPVQRGSSSDFGLPSVYHESLSGRL